MQTTIVILLAVIVIVIIRIDRNTATTCTNQQHLYNILKEIKDELKWMHEWYKRRGYVDVKPHEQMEGCIWMSKKLEQ